MPSYSVAIRTLGTSPVLRPELESIFSQTILPDKVVIYIAKGYVKPSFRVGNEIYVEVDKGMMRQRVLPYSEIESQYLLMLDDDVTLEPDSAAKMLDVLTRNSLDCVVADTFHIQSDPLPSRIYSALTNFTLPHFSKDKAIKVNCGSTFSYLHRIEKPWYPAESGAGPASLWRMKSFHEMHYEDELWIDRLGFAYGDDQIIFNKLAKNKRKLGMIFDSGCVHRDSKTSSALYKRDPDRFRKRSMARYLVWRRTCLDAYPHSLTKRTKCRLAYGAQFMWMIPAHLAAGFRQGGLRPLFQMVKGLLDGISFADKEEFKSLPCYITAAGTP